MKKSLKKGCRRNVGSSVGGMFARNKSSPFQIYCRTDRWKISAILKVYLKKEMCPERELKIQVLFNFNFIFKICGAGAAAMA